MVEKKMKIRYPFKASVSYQTLGNPSNTSVGESVDISSGGICIRDRLRLEKGILIQVMVPVSEHMVMVPVISEVTWSEEVTTGSYQTGLKFLK